MARSLTPMETEADKLRLDVQRYCYLLGRITDKDAVELLLELIGEAVARLNEIEQSETAQDE